jgi:hypothetical protein
MAITHATAAAAAIEESREPAQFAARSNPDGGDETATAMTAPARETGSARPPEVADRATGTDEAGAGSRGLGDGGQAGGAGSPDIGTVTDHRGWEAVDGAMQDGPDVTAMFLSGGEGRYAAAMDALLAMGGPAAGHGPEGQDHAMKDVPVVQDVLAEAVGEGFVEHLIDRFAQGGSGEAGEGHAPSAADLHAALSGFLLPVDAGQQDFLPLGALAEMETQAAVNA